MPDFAPPSAAQICAVAELGEAATALLRDELAARDYLNLLLENHHFPDAVRFIAHSLPKREAVWWGWYCARRTAGPDPKGTFQAALNATEQWISQPTEENRRAAYACGEAAEFGTAAGCACLGAFFSGGSLAPPNCPVVPPGDFLTAKAVSGAVIFAAISSEPEKAEEKFRAFLDQGVGVINRIKVWGKE
jgi:hypothetical protein